MAGLYNGECLPWEWFVVSDYCEEHSEYCTSLQGCSQDFSRGGVTAGTPSGDRRLYKVYTTALPRVSAGSVVLIIAAWRPILTKDKSRWQKYFTKKQILKKWAFQQWLLQPRHCHGVFTTWKGLPRGGHRHPRNPPSYAPASLTPVVYFKHLCSC